MPDAARTPTARLKTLALTVGIALIATVGFAPSAGAAIINVSTTSDDFAGGTSLSCSVREAIQAANSNSNLIGGSPSGCPAGNAGAFDTDTINVPAGADYPLTRNGVDSTNSAGDLDVVDSNLIIQASGGGQGGTAIVCSGCGDRVMDIQNTAFGVTIAGLRIAGGSAAGDGGGILSTTQLTLLNSTVNGNSATGNGGGISHTGSSALTLNNATVTGNQAAGRGGGVASNASVNSFWNNSTVVGNTGDTDESGGAEAAGAGINVFGTGLVNISNTILAQNLVPGVDGGDECGPNVTSGDHNILGDGGNCTSFSVFADDLVGTFFGGEIPANLNGLGNYGGTVWTMQPLRTSPAINRGYPGNGGGTNCMTTDARGQVDAVNFNRPAEGRCDIGAFEVQNPGPLSVNVSGTGDQLDPAPTFSGTCSLREAVTATNLNQATGGCPAGAGGAMDTINVPAGTYNLTRTGALDDTNVNGDLDLIPKDPNSGVVLAVNPVTILGTGTTLTVIDGSGGGDRILQTQANTDATVNGVSMRAGNAGGSDGGAIYSNGGLSLRNLTLSGNSALGNGGGAHYTGTGFGALSNVTVSGNQAGGNGGGISTDSAGDPGLNNVTVTQNTADFDGGPAAGGGGLGGGGSFFAANSIIAGNTDASGGDTPDCVSLFSSGHVLIGRDGGCSFVPAGGDQVGTNASPITPLLGALTDNGGRSLTHAPLFGSPALNAGHPGSGPLAPCEATDQRGVARPLAGRCDIGAVEIDPAAPSVPPTVTPTPTTSTPTPAPKRCKKGRKLKKGKCVKKKKKR